MRTKLALLSLICSIYFFSYFQRVAVPGTIFNELQIQFAAGAAAIATLGAIYLYLYGGMQFCAGVMVDSLGAGRTLVLGGALLALGSLAFPLAGSLGALYAARALVGLGASLVFISVLKEVDNLFEPKQFPLFLAIAIALGFSGGLVATLPFERLVHLVGWRTALLLAGFACALCVIWTFRVLRRHGRMARGHGAWQPATLLRVFANRRARPLLVAGPINFAVYFLLQATIGKKLLQDCAGMSSAGAAGVTFVMMFTTMAAIFGQGLLSQRFPRRRPFIITNSCLNLASMSMILLTLTLGPGPGWLTFAYLVSALSAGGIQPATLMKELSPPKASATAVGVYNGLVYLAVALLSNLAGLVMDLFRDQAVSTPDALVYPVAAYRPIFAGCLLLAALSVGAAMRIREPAPGR